MFIVDASLACPVSHEDFADMDVLAVLVFAYRVQIVPLTDHIASHSIQAARLP